MALAAPRRLPGLRFEAQPPAPEEALPRMDIAGFVGFAASGPIGVPVAVEDAAEFATVFGADAPLAHDEQRGEAVHALLAPAVRAFFRNGGRRCWVVRVAGRSVVRDGFELPGLARVRSDGTLRPALARASSPGSWADSLRVSTAVSASAVRFEDLNVDSGHFTALLADRAELRAGDLIRFGSSASPSTLLVVVASVDALAPAPAPTAGVRVAVTAGPRSWLGPAALAADAHGEVRYLDARGLEQVTAADVQPPTTDGLLRLALPIAPAVAPRLGSLVRAVFAGREAYLQASAIEAAGTGVVLAGSPLSVEPPAPTPALATAGIAERLELELRVEGGGRPPGALSALGFAPRHRRYLGALPDDARRHAVSDRPREPTAEAFAARFPLAGRGSTEAWYLPLGGDPWVPRWLGALRPEGSARERDGLARLDHRVFVDAALASTSAPRLVAAADWIRDHSPDPRALRGIHALLSVEEVTLVAVPDAAQRPWLHARAGRARRPVAAPPPPAPDRSRFSDCAAHVAAAPTLTKEGDEETGAFELRWSESDVADAVYELQESTDAGYAGAETLYRGVERAFEVYGRPRGSILYYRVRALDGAIAGAWSDPLRVRLTAPSRWLLHPSADYDPTGLLDVQLALLRMCAARGDQLAVLCLPEHYREHDAIAHVAMLKARAGRPAGSLGPDALFSYGALYHPWLQAAEPDRPGAVRRQPPDGAAGGVLAARAALRGAWVAPANVALRDVLALAPAIDAGARQALQDARVNLVRHEPGGFLWLCADTLSDDEELRAIGVRRLLQTLQRLALRHGATMAFEPNDELARRAVRRSFEALLGRMFELGAFAGTGPSEGFRVETPASAADHDAGRLVVELRVAPARPLEFLTVRLVRTGTGQISVEARSR